MNSTFLGQHISLSLFGESHGPSIGITFDGLPAGIPLDLDGIRTQLEKRKPKGKISTARQEADEFEIVSGFFNGFTTGTPLCLLIRNTSQHSRDYEKTKFLMRPSHADYTAFEKYHGFQDYRGGGHFSGRVTAPVVAAGAICMQLLHEHGIRIASHIARCQDICDIPFSNTPDILETQMQHLNQSYFPVLSEEAARDMTALMENAHAKGDSVGGVLETIVTNLPAGIGNPFFDSIESILSHLLFSIPAVKGVEFGLGFGFADLYGSEANDPFRMEGGKVTTSTNHNAGINGGISNGMPIIFRTAVKPTPSIYQQQETIDYQSKQNASLTIQGRHDPAIIHRARVVVDSMAAIALLDLGWDVLGIAHRQSFRSSHERGR